MLTAPLLLSIISLLLVGRGSCKGPCDPLTPEYCLLPFPNSFFVEPSSRSPTGVQVNFSADAFPLDNLGRGIDLAAWNTMDGFSPFPSILAYFADLNDSSLPPHWDMSQSLTETCPTVLLDASSGKKIPHFAELDSAAHLPKRALMIWPSQRLNDNNRYIVALRNLHDNSGKLVKPSNAFLALRDNVSTTDPDIEDRRPLFKDIFNRLESAGVAKETLQLAWDFSTASLDCLTKRLLFARNDALARVGAKGPSYSIFQVKDHYSSSIHRRILGIMTVPIYTSTIFPGAHLVTNEQGLPVYQGTAEATFTVLVPNSVANGSVTPARVVQYGHGLFGNQREVEDGYLQSLADSSGYILAACDWWGMTQYDLPSIILMFSSNISNFRIIPDRLTQGMVNALLLMRLMKGGLASDPHLTFGGKPVIDPQLTSYYGNSLGGILGEVYMAATTDVERGVLGVAGGPFGIVLPRNKDFTLIEDGLRILYSDPVDFSTFIAFANMLWSRLEPSAYMASITSNPLPGTPTHRVLYQYALGDAQVNILALYSIARSAGAVLFANHVLQQFSLPGGQLVTEKLFGLQVVADNTTVTKGSVAVGFDCGAPPEPAGNIPPYPKTDTHNEPRHSKLGQKQIELFLRTGEIVNVCSGPCKC